MHLNAQQRHLPFECFTGILFRRGGGLRDGEEVRGCFLAVFGLKVICLLCLRLCLRLLSASLGGLVVSLERGEGIGIGSRKGGREVPNSELAALQTDARQHWRRIKQT